MKIAIRETLSNKSVLFLFIRWVKFEEVLEEKGKRWSKPHVSSLYMQSLTELQLLLASNPIFLDLDVNNMFELTGE